MQHPITPLLLVTLLQLAGCTPAPAPEPPPEDATPVPADSPTLRRLRVLYVESVARWEYRFLKNALTRDASCDVHCFLTSADADFPQESSRTSDDPRFRSPLAALPGTMQELLDYDVVILGDVAPSEWPEAGLLARFVTEFGRGLVLLAGEQHMPRAWKATALDPVLPVDLASDPAEPGDYRLTTTGSESPLLALARTRAQTVELWEDRDGRGDGLVPVRWILATHCRTAAVTLVETGPDNRPAPLFVTLQAGAGRVFFSATDETWRWRFATGDEPWYGPFWKRVIAWAAG